VNKIEHLGIAVKDLAASEQIFTDLLGAAPYKREAVESENVITSFFMWVRAKLNCFKLHQMKVRLRNSLNQRAKEFTTLLSLLMTFKVK